MLSLSVVKTLAILLVVANLVFSGTLVVKKDPTDEDPDLKEIDGLPCFDKDFGAHLPHPFDIHKYLICVTATTLWIAPCPDRLVFNTFKGVCDWTLKPPAKPKATTSRINVKGAPKLVTSNIKGNFAPLRVKEDQEEERSTMLFGFLSTARPETEMERMQNEFDMGQMPSGKPTSATPRRKLTTMAPMDLDISIPTSFPKEGEFDTLMSQMPKAETKMRRPEMPMQDSFMPKTETNMKMSEMQMEDSFMPKTETKMRRPAMPMEDSFMPKTETRMRMPETKMQDSFMR